MGVGLQPQTPFIWHCDFCCCVSIHWAPSGPEFQRTLEPHSILLGRESVVAWVGRQALSDLHLTGSYCTFLGQAEVG